MKIRYDRGCFIVFLAFVIVTGVYSAWGQVQPYQPQGVDLVPRASVNYNVAAAIVVKPALGRVARISVIVAGTAPGAVYDSVSTAGNGAANQVFVIPNTVGMYPIDFPCFNGITVAPGTGQTVAVAWY